MNKSKILKALIFFIFLFLLFLPINSLTNENPFHLPELKLNTHFSPLYPKHYFFGTSTFLGDSSGFLVTNKGIAAWDTLKTYGDIRAYRDAYIKGFLYLDTAGLFSIFSSGNDFWLNNLKQDGQLYFQSTGYNSSFKFGYGRAGYSTLATIDTSGLTINIGNVTVSGTTRKIIAPQFVIANSSGAETCGQATLGGGSGTVTVNTSAVNSNSVIIATWRETSTSVLYIQNIIDGTSFDITSSGGGGDDGKKVSWLFLNTQ